MEELILHLPDPDGSATRNRSPPQLLDDPMFSSFDYLDMPRDYRSPPTIFSPSTAAAGSPVCHSSERDLGAGRPRTNSRDGPPGADGGPPGGDGGPPGGDGGPPGGPGGPSGPGGIGGRPTRGCRRRNRRRYRPYSGKNVIHHYTELNSLL